MIQRKKWNKKLGLTIFLFGTLTTVGITGTIAINANNERIAKEKEIEESIKESESIAESERVWKISVEAAEEAKRKNEERQAIHAAEIAKFEQQRAQEAENTNQEQQSNSQTQSQSSTNTTHNNTTNSNTGNTQVASNSTQSSSNTQAKSSGAANNSTINNATTNSTASNKPLNEKSSWEMTKEEYDSLTPEEQGKAEGRRFGNKNSSWINYPHWVYEQLAKEGWIKYNRTTGGIQVSSKTLLDPNFQARLTEVYQKGIGKP